jgi:cytochrome c peroxidase
LGALVLLPRRIHGWALCVSIAACGGSDPQLEAADARPDAAMAAGGAAVSSAEFRWKLPQGFPTPLVPADNPMSAAKVELGRFLFYDKRLSNNQTQACATCHEQALAFTDGRATGLGSTGQGHPRSPMSLVNLAYATSLTWANPLFAMGVLPEPLERQTQIADLRRHSDRAGHEVAVAARAAPASSRALR